MRGWVFHEELHAEDELAVYFALFAFGFTISTEALAAGGFFALGAHGLDDVSWVLWIDSVDREADVELVLLLLCLFKFCFIIEEESLQLTEALTVLISRSLELSQDNWMHDDFRLIFKKHFVFVCQLLYLPLHIMNDLRARKELEDVSRHLGVDSFATTSLIFDYRAYSNNFSLPDIDITAKSQFRKSEEPKLIRVIFNPEF